MPATSVSEYHARYRQARVAFDSGDPKSAATLLGELLELMLRTILLDEHVDIYDNEDYLLAKQELSPPSSREREWDLDTLCNIFDAVNIFEMCGTKYPLLRQNHVMLRSFRLSNIYAIISHVQAGAWEQGVQQLSIQQVLCLVFALLTSMTSLKVMGIHLLVNVTKLKSLMSAANTPEAQEETIHQYVKYLDADEGPSGVFKKEFDLIKVRGMLINTADGSRNVSFSCDTFVRILTTVYEEISHTSARISGGASEKDPSGIAARVLFRAGYASGSGFGRTLYRLFQRDTVPKKLEEKIGLWCHFDSDVGFGAFRASDIKVVDDNRISARIALSDNFVVVGKDAADANLCVFMTGYIQGVLERLTKLPLRVMHDPMQCEQFIPGEGACTFIVETDSERLAHTMDLVKQRRDIARQEDFPGSLAEGGV